MKTIENILDTINKFGDTETVFRLRLKDGDDYVSLGNKPVILNIANSYGLVLSTPLTDQSGDTIELDFKSQELSKLTPDAYKLEFEVTMVDGDVAKFPTKDGFPFHITNNLKQTQGALIPTITFDDVLSSVDDKVNEYIHTIQKGDKGDVMQSKDNTFTGNNTFNKLINGALNTRPATFTDFADVAKHMDQYAGNWVVSNKAILNAPIPAALYYMVYVFKGSYSNNNGYVIVTNFDDVVKQYITGINNGVISGWHLIANDYDVLHNTGNETVAGDKTFTGQTTMRNGSYGLRVTNSGIQKTSDNGITWVSI